MLFFQKNKQITLTLPLILLSIFSLAFNSSCKKITEKTASTEISVFNAEKNLNSIITDIKNTENQTTSGTMLPLPKITDVLLLESNSDSDSIFSFNSKNMLNWSSTHATTPVKLLCIPNSLAYLSFVVDDFDLNGIIQDDHLYISAEEVNLIKECQSKINLKNLNLQVSRLGIRYNSTDYEIINTHKTTNPIKVTRDFVKTLTTNPITNLNIYCSLNNTIFTLSNIGYNELTFDAIPYFQPPKNHTNNIIIDKDNLIFLNLDRMSIQNQGYKFHDPTFKAQDINFDDCKQNMYAVSEQTQYQNIYFIDDLIPANEEINFLTEEIKPSASNGEEEYFLLCYYIDRNKKLNWHWGFDSLYPIKKTRVTGNQNDGIFETNTSKNILENACYNFSKSYEEGEWKLFNMEVTNKFWAWGIPIKYKNLKEESDLLNGSNFENIVVFGDSIADNGNSKHYSSSITGRISNKRQPPYLAGRYTNGFTMVEYFSQLVNKPLYNWANLSQESFTKQNNLNAPISNSIRKYLTESPIWGGGKNKNKNLYFIQIAGSTFINQQTNIDDNFKNIARDLKSAVNQLIEGGAKTIILPYIYDLTPILMSVKQIEPNDYEKYNKKLFTIYKEIISTTSSDYGPNVHVIGISYSSLLDAIKNDIKINLNSFGFLNISSPCLNETICNNPSQYFYFNNSFYPSSSANLMLALYSIDYLKNILLSNSQENIKVNLIAEEYYNKVFKSENKLFFDLNYYDVKK